MPAASSGRLGPQGPSASAVMGLNVSKPPSEIGGPRPQPPLQRVKRPMIGHPHPPTEAECTLSHLQQLKDRQREQKRDARADRREHRRELLDLCKKCEVDLEDTAARRAWHRQVAQQQQAQQGHKVERELSEHRRDYADNAFFPFKSKQGGPPLPDKPTYGQLLRAQAEEDRRRDALRIMQEGVKRDAAVPLLAASLPADPPPKAANAAADDARAATLRDGTRRAVELRLRQVAQQQQRERYAAQMQREQEREEATCAARALQHQRQMRQVLSLQAADKAQREVAEHVQLFGEHGGLLPPEESAAEARVALRRQELEAAIAEKQRERRRLKAARKAEEARARREARQGELLDARDEQGRREASAELRLAWAKQEAELRQRRRKDAERSVAERLEAEERSRATREA